MVSPGKCLLAFARVAMVLGLETVTSTRPETVVTRGGTPTTIPATTIVRVPIPPSLETLGPDVVGEIINLAPTVTSVNPAEASELTADLASYRSAYISAHPPPAIISEALGDLNHNSEISPELQFSIFTHLNPYAASTVLAELGALVSPYPTLSSELFAYLSALRTYEPGLLLGAASIISDDLSVTAAPPPIVSVLESNLPTGGSGAAASIITSTLTESSASATGSAAASATAAAATSTSTSSGQAAPTGGAMVGAHAAALVVGMVGVALL